MRRAIVLLFICAKLVCIAQAAQFVRALMVCVAVVSVVIKAFRNSLIVAKMHGMKSVVADTLILG